MKNQPSYSCNIGTFLFIQQRSLTTPVCDILIGGNQVEVGFPHVHFPRTTTRWLPSRSLTTPVQVECQEDIESEIHARFTLAPLHYYTCVAMTTLWLYYLVWYMYFLCFLVHLYKSWSIL